MLCLVLKHLFKICTTLPSGLSPQAVCLSFAGFMLPAFVSNRFTMMDVRLAQWLHVLVTGVRSRAFDDMEELAVHPLRDLPAQLEARTTIGTTPVAVEGCERTELCRDQWRSSTAAGHAELESIKQKRLQFGMGDRTEQEVQKIADSIKTSKAIYYTLTGHEMADFDRPLTMTPSLLSGRSDGFVSTTPAPSPPATHTMMRTFTSMMRFSSVGTTVTTTSSSPSVEKKELAAAAAV